MAKVLVSIPDALLERVDAYVKANRETRSGFLQRLAERELARDAERRQQEVARLLDELAALPPGDNADRSVTEMIREDRESH